MIWGLKEKNNQDDFVDWHEQSRMSAVLFTEMGKMVRDRYLSELSRSQYNIVSSGSEHGVFLCVRISKYKYGSMNFEVWYCE